MKFQKFVKTIIDFLGAGIGLIITSPLFLVIAVLIKLDSEGSVFFRQERLGKNGKPFIILKFRSMTKGAEKIGIGATEDDYRITKVGRFIRKWTLDELPQFINILRGEMSLVGPRPLPQYRTCTEEYKKFQEERLSVKPGMISLVDVKGRNLVPWKQRLELDNWYIENWSLWLDLKLIFSIPFVVFSRKGVYGERGENKPLSE